MASLNDHIQNTESELPVDLKSTSSDYIQYKGMYATKFNYPFKFSIASDNVPIRIVLL